MSSTRGFVIIGGGNLRLWSAERNGSDLALTLLFAGFLLGLPYASASYMLTQGRYG
jgi:hypothetical protein